MRKIVLIALFTGFITSMAYGSENIINVCCAENFYGNIAKVIGGKYVKVDSIISNPEADPHLFSTSPQIGIELSKAQIVVFNGADYDPWLPKLLNVQGNNNKLSIIDVSELMNIKKGSNPHIWYIPETFPKLAKKLADVFGQINPKQKTYFNKNLDCFLKGYSSVEQKIIKIKSEHSNISVTATEPVFNYMAKALGFKIYGKKMQWVVMNDSSASPQMRINFIKMLKSKNIKILFYNDQVTNPITESLKKAAIENGVKIIGVSETMPANTDVTQWFIKYLDEIDKAISNTNH